MKVCVKQIEIDNNIDAAEDSKSSEQALKSFDSSILKSSNKGRNSS